MILLNCNYNQINHNSKIKIMPGHGTILTTSGGQDDSSVAVDDNGGASTYDVGTQAAVNYTGGTVNSGEVVEVNWDEDKNELQITRVGNRAKGNVDEEGTTFTVTDSGDTALTGSVSISSKYGENDGWAGSEGITCGNVNGKAAYLAE